MALIIINAETMHLFKSLERIGGLCRRGMKNSSTFGKEAQAASSDTLCQTIPSLLLTGLLSGEARISEFKCPLGLIASRLLSQASQRIQRWSKKRILWPNCQKARTRNRDPILSNIPLIIPVSYINVRLHLLHAFIHCFPCVRPQRYAQCSLERSYLAVGINYRK